MLRRHICLSRISDFVISFNFFAYYKFYSDWGRVVGKIKQNELDCRDTAPLKNGNLVGLINPSQLPIYSCSRHPLQSLLKTNFDSQTRKTWQLDPTEQSNEKLQLVKTTELDDYLNFVFCSIPVEELKLKQMSPKLSPCRPGNFSFLRHTLQWRSHLRQTDVPRHNHPNCRGRFLGSSAVNSGSGMVEGFPPG